MKNKKSSNIRNIIYIIISAIIFALIFASVLYVEDFRQLDLTLLKTIQGIIILYPESFAAAVSTFGGDYCLLWPQLTALAALFSHKKYSDGILLVIMTQLSWHGVDIFKPFIQRERPCGDLYPGFSFPSGHATTTMFFYGAIIYLVFKYVHNNFWKYLITAFCTVFIILVGLARLKLNVHFTTDVIAGYCLGVILLNIYIILNRFFNKN